jgi:hypothetical protein
MTEKEEEFELEEETEEESESEEETGKDQSAYDKKEEEARAEIQEMFGDVGDELREVQDKFSKLLKLRPELVAGKYRIKVPKEVLDDMSEMRELNELISESSIFLKNYIDFGRDQTPNFDYIKNLIVKFQESLNEEQNRRFAIVHARNDEYYITKPVIDYYLKPIHIWISRIIGTLTSAGNYLVIVPPARENPHDIGGMGGGDFDGGADMGAGDMGGVGTMGGDDSFQDNIPYANGTNWWKQNNNNRFIGRGTRMKPTMREFGDVNTK